MKVAIIAGGLSHERDVSLRSGRRVAEALRQTGCEVSVHDLSSELLPQLQLERPDVVWPLLHGATGEDGAVADVLDLIRVPYVGSPAESCALGWDKPVAKQLLSQAGVSTPNAMAFPQDLFRDLGAGRLLDAIGDRFGFPLIVKPSRGGSALGVSLVRRREDFARAMVDCFAYGDVAMVEAFQPGIEVAVSVVDVGDGPRALPAVEISTDGVYDFDARVNPGRTEYFAPARLSESAAVAAADVALRAHAILGLRSISRSDLIVDADGHPWFLEVNVAPGMTETSLLPLAASAAGWDRGMLYRQIAESVAI